MRVRIAPWVRMAHFRVPACGTRGTFTRVQAGFLCECACVLCTTCNMCITCSAGGVSKQDTRIGTNSIFVVLYDISPCSNSMKFEPNSCPILTLGHNVQNTVRAQDTVHPAYRVWDRKFPGMPHAKVWTVLHVVGGPCACAHAGRGAGDILHKTHRMLGWRINMAVEP